MLLGSTEPNPVAATLNCLPSRFRVAGFPESIGWREQPAGAAGRHHQPVRQRLAQGDCRYSNEDDDSGDNGDDDDYDDDDNDDDVDDGGGGGDDDDDEDDGDDDDDDDGGDDDLTIMPCSLSPPSKLVVLEYGTLRHYRKSKCVSVSPNPCSIAHVLRQPLLVPLATDLGPRRQSRLHGRPGHPAGHSLAGTDVLPCSRSASCKFMTLKFKSSTTTIALTTYLFASLFVSSWTSRACISSRSRSPARTAPTAMHTST